MTRARLPSSPTGYRTVVEDVPPQRESPTQTPVDLTREVWNLAGQVAQLKVELTELKAALANLVAANRSETTKLIVGGLVTVALAFAGGRAATPAPPAPEVRAVRTSFEIELDGCKILEGDVARSECIARVVAKHAAPNR